MTLDASLTQFRQHRFAILFVLLFCVILIPPYFDNTPWVGILSRGILTCVLLWALYTVTDSSKVFLLAIILLIPTLASTWLSGPDESPYLAYLDNASNIVYFGLICVFLGRYIFTQRTVTQEVIFAAMCLYILMAALWAAIYSNLQLFYTDAFMFHGALAAEAGISREELFQYMIYYSFVTLSTLGYGEIIPIHRVAQNWAAVEAMLGQFYIAVVLARLVSMYTVEKSSSA